MSTKAQYRLGRIISAYLRTKKAGKQRHPAVIITPDAEIVQPEDFDPRKGGENVLVVAGVSTKYKFYQEPHIPLPYHPSRQACTKLTQDCAVIIGWYDAITIPDDVLDFGGDVPPELMLQVNDAVRNDIARRIGNEFSTFAELVHLLFQS